MLATRRLATLMMATSAAALLSTAVGHAETPADTVADSEPKEVVVIGKRVIKGSAGATGLDLSLRETPQSVTVLDAQQIKDFALTSANQLLLQVPGIEVIAAETDRTMYASRGFDITNFQVDGVGQPLIWGIQYGDIDTAIYERVEAVRGANGMMTGTGNPSATINYIRKRPTQAFKADISASYGSWDDKRLTADISGALNKSGTLAGRFVYAGEDKDSWLDYNHVNRNTYYGIVSWDITPKLKLTGGYSQQDNLADGVTWGALPLTELDGTPITYYKTSDTTSAPWTYWNTHDKSTFGEVSYAFDNGWTAKVTGTHRELNYDSELLYAWPYAAYNTIIAYSGHYPSDAKQNMIDAQASGPFTLFGREHQLVVGINTADATSLQWSGAANAYSYYSDISSWLSSPPADTGFTDLILQEDTETKTNRLYGAVHLNLSDRLKGVVGFNAIQLKEVGYSYSVSNNRSDHAVSPYVGAVYDLTKNISAYASYSDIYNPQYEVDVNHQTLPAATGKSYEGGLKSEWFEKRLYAAVTLFKSEQHNLAEAAGTDPDTFATYYAPTEAYAKGYEVEVAGNITPQWTLNGGWSDLEIKDADGNDSRLYSPRRMLKLSSTYRVPQWRDLKIGGAVRWQSDTSTVDNTTTIVQKAYAVTDLMANIRLTDHVSAGLNLKNVFNQRYWSTLAWGQAYYAAPSSYTFTLNYSY
ncbi:MAG: TonB-dependent siderophore receptor [Asticcacaulis sp.]|uniref:TonB-dependent siderophore receptor n=1 Tax=Asticcacaulis sp. TaxID=1872648 RepID=UPI0039E38814